MIRVDELGPESEELISVAEIHTSSLDTSIMSLRGSRTIASFYRFLISRGHILYVVREDNKILGGLFMQISGQEPVSMRLLLIKPQTWLVPAFRMGPVKFTSAARDMVRLRRLTAKLPPHNYITSLFIDLKHRNLGIGSLLLQHAISASRFRGVGLGVDTYKSNDAANSLYRRHGMVTHYETSKSRVYFLNR